MRFFKNKFFIIALSFALFIVILTSTLAIMGQTDPIKNVLNTVSIPFRYVGMWIKESISGYERYYSSLEELDEENQKLESEIAALKKQVADAQAIKEENERLRQYLEMKNTYPDFHFTEAMIIGTQSENYMTVFMLNKGSGDGIGLGMPVVTPYWLVGSVCEVGYAWCKVRTITEASSSVGAYLSRSGENGILSGDISLKDTGLCMLTYLSPNADIEVGDLVYTSGEGSVYPRDILVGRVESVEQNDYLRTKIARVQCAVDFKSLKYVTVITDFDIKARE